MIALQLCARGPRSHATVVSGELTAVVSNCTSMTGKKALTVRGQSAVVPASPETVQDAYADRRDGARFAMKLPASVRIPGQPRIPTRLLDISRTGCRLLTPGNWARGTSFWLTISGLAQAQFCHVMWSHEKFAGVRFAVPLEATLFETLLAEHGQLSEGEANELKALSAQCAKLARGIKTEEAQHLSTLAQDCDAGASAVEQGIQHARTEQREARMRQLLSRLSTPTG